MEPSAPLHADQPDEALARLSRQGDLQAFEALVDRYRDELFRFLARFLRDAHAAEDVFQETFIQVHQSLETFDDDRRFRPWLFTIAANKARDLLRRNRRQAVLSISTPLSIDPSGAGERTVTDLLEDNLPLPTDAAAQAELNALVAEVVSSLPDHLREILVFAYFHQFSYKQIAEMVDIPLGTVKSRLHAAVGTFAEIWKSRYQTLGSGKS